MLPLRCRAGLALALALSAVVTACRSPESGPPEGQDIGPPAKLTIDASGGSITSPDSVLTVTVPPGALSGPVEITIQPITNLAPAGQGNAYRLGPAGQPFAAPVTLTFHNVTTLPASQLWVSYRLYQTLWLRAQNVTIDGTSNTITTTAPDFGWTDWSVVETGPNVGRDLVGTFNLTSTLSPVLGSLPFSATGTLTLAYAGEDSRASYYFPAGPITIATPVAVGTATCLPVSPPGATVQVSSTAVAEIHSSPVELRWAINAMWSVTCSDGSSGLVDTEFDTLGIALGGCTRSYVGVPVITTSKLQCDAGNACAYVIDCGALGKETATFNFGLCTQGATCTSSNPCHTAAISCTSGFPVCTDTGSQPNGTACPGGVCGGGVCNACTQNQTCTSTNPCDLTASIECSSGFPVCTDRTFRPPGTSCGTDQVCSAAGACVSCAASQPCTTQPDQLCHLGVTDCSTGTSVCVNGAAKPNGTACGTDQVCNGGACVSCAAGQPCTTQPDQLCHVGVTDCSSGTLACVNGAAKPNGTVCGTDQVCNGGTCISCAANQPCTTQPDQLCHLGVTDCSTGTSVCLNGAPKLNGTSCGTNLVCNNGTCSACTQGAACLSTNPCDATATIECSSGSPVCTDRTFQPPGTSCGANLVCSPSGTCVACTQGAACTSANPCDVTATIECSSGAPVCTDRTFLPPGTSCGANQVCSPSGACIACTQGAACTSTNPCDATATIECSSGAPVCTDRTFQPAGTSCGTNKVCSPAGACIDCMQGASCTSANPCHTAAIVCGSGAPVCTDNGNQPNGATCGTGQTCNAGTCVASRTVSGSRMVTYWPDTGPLAAVPSPDVSGVGPQALVEALVSDGAGGRVTYQGTFSLSGAYSIPNVPAGSYLLHLVDGSGLSRLVDTSSSSVDLGFDVLGRNDLVKASGPTPVTFDVSGLNPWNTAGDQIQITASNANVWDFLNTSALTGSAIAASVVEEWFASNATAGPLNLVAASDGLYVHQLATTSTTCNTTPCNYRAASNATSPALSGIVLNTGTNPPIAAPLTTLAPLTGSITVNWSLSQFEPFLALMNPSAITDASAHSLVVGANAYPLMAAGPVANGTPSLFELRVPAGTGDLNMGALNYGQFLLSTLWNEWRGGDLTAHVSYTAPGTPVPTALVENVSVGRREPMSPLPATPIVPTLSPVQSPLINASSAFATLTGVGLTPSISWTAPATGAPTSYTVDVYWLHAVAGASVSTRVASWTTVNTNVSPPPGMLVSGNTYYTRITANVILGDPFATAPFRKLNVFTYAGTLTGTFSP